MPADATGDAPDVHVKLEEIAARLRNGEKVEPITARELLRWFGAKRRGLNKIWEVKSALYANDLRTEPDFQFVYIDGPIELKLGKHERDHQVELDLSSDLSELDALDELPPGAKIIFFPGAASVLEGLTDPTFRIKKLDSANKPPTSVKPNDSLATAITIMLANDYSQLPVMTNDRDVKGVVSWPSIGARLAVGTEVRECEVRECMDEAHPVSENTSLFEAIEYILRDQFVLIYDSTKKISGIVTANDLSMKFLELAEPFLRLEELEKHINILGSS